MDINNLNNNQDLEDMVEAALADDKPQDELKKPGVFTPTKGSNYSDTMNQLMSAAINEWWKGLSKEDLLDYIAGQPTLTADVLREIFDNSGSILAFDMRFDSAKGQAVVDFHTK